MATDSQPDLVTVNIDGRDLDVPKGMNMIEAARLAGKEVPHYCYHPKLSVAGNCRMCLIEMGMPMRDRATGEAVLDDDGKPKIGWMPKPAIACATNAGPGVHIRTDSPLVKECRDGVTEFLLINHPLDCPICDQAGECRLQEFSADHGRGYSRFVEQKNVKPKRTRLGPRVMLDDERCILCSRCIRFSQEIAHDDVLGFVDRGSYSTLTCFPGRQLENNYSLNTVDICPVGALTSTDFRFKMRVWFLKPVNSICTESSVGANTQVWCREGKIYRITPRRNDAVNDTWMTDSGRALHAQVEADDRLTDYTVDGVARPLQDAVDAAVALLGEGGVGVVASARSSVEEQFFFRQLADRAASSVHMVAHTGEGDGILLSEDRTPNLRGALLNGLVSGIPDESFEGLAREIESGALKTLVVAHEDLATSGLSRELLGKVKLVYFGTHANETSRLAHVVFPSLTVFEKEGSFVNQLFRLQRFAAAVPGPRGVLPDVAVLEKIVAPLANEKAGPMNAAAAWERMATIIPSFAGISFAAIPADGLPLDPADFLHLPFVETKNLKYDPEAFREAHAAPVEA